MVHEILILLFIIASIIAVVEIKRSSKQPYEQPVPSHGGDRDGLEPIRLAKVAIVVDASRLMRASVARTLEREGYRVTGATDGYDAHQRLAELDAPPEDLLAVVDVSPSTVAGMNFVQALRTDTRYAARIIAMVHDTEAARVGDGGGAYESTEYITKPFTSEALLSLIRS